MSIRTATTLAAAVLAAATFGLSQAPTATAATLPAPAVHVMTAEDADISLMLSITQDGTPPESLTAGASITYRVDVQNNADPALEGIAVSDTGGKITFRPQGETSAAKGKSVHFVSDPVKVTPEQASAGSLSPTIKVTATRGGTKVEKTEALAMTFSPAAAEPSATAEPTATPSPSATATTTAEPEPEPEVSEMPLVEPEEKVKIPAGEPAAQMEPTQVLAAVGAGLALAALGGFVFLKRRAIS